MPRGAPADGSFDRAELFAADALLGEVERLNLEGKGSVPPATLRGIRELAAVEGVHIPARAGTPEAVEAILEVQDRILDRLRRRFERRYEPLDSAGEGV